MSKNSGVILRKGGQRDREKAANISPFKVPSPIIRTQTVSTKHNRVCFFRNNPLFVVLSHSICQGKYANSVSQV